MGFFKPKLRQGELLMAPVFPRGGRSVFYKLTRRHGDYAIIGLAVHESRFVFFGAGATPIFVRMTSASKGLKESLANLKQELHPPADLYNTSATKLHLAGVLLERAWTTLSKPR